MTKLKLGPLLPRSRPAKPNSLILPMPEQLSPRIGTSSRTRKAYE